LAWTGDRRSVPAGLRRFQEVAVNRPAVLILGPHRDAISGVSTHVNLLMDSALGDDFELLHFQVGAEGRKSEGALGKALRLLASPFALFATILFRTWRWSTSTTSLNHARLIGATSPTSRWRSCCAPA
jgi:hypothetical protein